MAWKFGWKSKEFLPQTRYSHIIWSPDWRILIWWSFKFFVIIHESVSRHLWSGSLLWTKITAITAIVMTFTATVTSIRIVSISTFLWFNNLFFVIWFFFSVVPKTTTIITFDDFLEVNQCFSFKGFWLVDKTDTDWTNRNPSFVQNSAEHPSYQYFLILQLFLLLVRIDL